MGIAAGSAKVQIGAELLCKGAKVKSEIGLGPGLGLGLEIRVARRLRGTDIEAQRCKCCFAAYKGAKVGANFDSSKSCGKAMRVICFYIVNIWRNHVHA